MTGALVCIVEGRLRYLRFDDLMDAKTKKTAVRAVDISKPAYRVAREYMIRLEREDFDNPERLEKIARAASNQDKGLSLEAFKEKFGHVVRDLRGGF
jgi:6-phosphofructokinase 1